MRGSVIGFVIGLAWGCGTTAGFTCEDDGDCTLSGTPGVCTEEGACAYPSDACTSGYAYPDGAPIELAGNCADVEVGGTEGTETDGGAGTVGETTSAPTSTAATEDSADGSDDQTDADGPGESTGAAVDTGDETGTCDQPFAIVQASEDTFFTGNCGIACDNLNWGATPVGALIKWDGSVSVLAIRFPDEELATIEIANVERIDLAIPAGPLMSASISVGTIGASFPWVEGNKDGEPAAIGDSSWVCYNCPGLPWGPAGPLGALSAMVGEVTIPAFTGSEVVIPLDVGTIYDEYLEGATGMLLFLNADQELGASLQTRESGTPAELRFYGC